MSSEPTLTAQKPQSKVWMSFVAGAVAGGVAKTVIAPLDRIKILYQTASEPFSFISAKRKFDNIVKNEGVARLWRGNSATLVRVIPYASIQFGVHAKMKKVFERRSKTEYLPGHYRYLAGSLAGMTASAMTYPLDLARARLAITTHSTYTNLFQLMDAMVRQYGVRSLFRGYLVCIIGQIPYAGTSFYTYETLKHSLHVRHNGDALTIPQRLGIGAMAGLLGQTASYPLDVVRRRFQTYGLTEFKTEYGIIATVKQIYYNEGIVSGFYKGLSMNWIKGPIAVSVSFLVHDGLIDFFSGHYLES